MSRGEIRPDIDINSVAHWFIISPLGFGMSTALMSYIHISTNDLKSVYLKYYALLKKQGFG